MKNYVNYHDKNTEYQKSTSDHTLYTKNHATTYHCIHHQFLTQSSPKHEICYVGLKRSYDTKLDDPLLVLIYIC